MAKITFELDDNNALAFYQAMTIYRAVEGERETKFHFTLGYSEADDGNYATKKFSVHPRNITLEIIKQGNENDPDNT